MIKIKTVFLDLDDTLVDFIGGLHRALNVPYEYSKYPYKKGVWDILGYQIILNDELVSYEQCNECCTFDFWQYLLWMHDGRDILRAIMDRVGLEKVYLLTTPMPNIESLTGKWLWISDNLPIYLKRTIITQVPKSLFAQSDILLIDDKDENVGEFQEAKGNAILVPRPWNKLHKYSDMSSQIVRKELEKYE